jgi:hypothetical protein
MDTESACLLVGLILYTAFAVWNGLRMSVQEALRFFRIDGFVCVVLVVCSIPLALDSHWGFLPDLIGTALMLVLGFAALLVIYAFLLGLVLLFRRAYRQVAARIVGVSALSLLMGFGILHVVGKGEKPMSRTGLRPVGYLERWADKCDSCFC